MANRKPKSAVVHECNARGVVPKPMVFRDKPAVIQGRMYPPTARVRVEDEDAVFDLIASMYAVVHEEVTGPCADILMVICHAWLERCSVRFPFLQDVRACFSALRERAAGLFANGVYGRDKHGGYVAAHSHHTHGRPGPVHRHDHAPRSATVSPAFRGPAYPPAAEQPTIW